MDPAHSSKLRAQELIRLVVRDIGSVREDTLQTMTAEARREVEEALLTNYKKIGASVLTLAKNLYTSNARFVFELLQNADDNEYSIAQSNKEVPSMSFKMYPDRIVVECNEDGFREHHIRAICDIGNSSKTASQGYIGEKGIGFKSVFMAAWKVHIQSGFFSFSFVHNKGDSGLGMIRPEWEEPATDKAHRGTCITLFLHRSDDADESSRNLHEIQKQFLDLQAPLLLFLRNIRRISVFCYDEDNRVTISKILSVSSADKTSNIVHLGTNDGNSLDSEIQSYHVTKHVASNLARSDNRTLSEAEESSKSYKKSEIVLAFPLSGALEPVIEPQKVFAFLPMRQVGFNFLIQADFVTQANREDIVSDSRRNNGLREGIADAFVKAMYEFSNHSHEPLQYSWVRYLPRKGHHWDPYWKSLVSDITRRVQEERVFRTLQNSMLRRIVRLRERPGVANDAEGYPLFADLKPGIYLSDRYTRDDMKILAHFGLKELSLNEMVALAESDLQSNSPRRRGSGVDDEWLRRAAAMLSLPFERKESSSKRVVESLDLIPLAGGDWTSKNDGPVFHPCVGNIPAPGDLGFKLVSPDAIQINACRKLFEHLGMTRLRRSVVRQNILARYQDSGPRANPPAASVEHLRFLYLTHRPSDMDSNPKMSIPIRTMRRSTSVRPGIEDVYVRDETHYGASTLLAGQKKPPFEVHFISKQYLDDIPDESKDAGMSWSAWLHDYIGVRRHIRLLDWRRREVSEEAIFIADDSPEQFCGFLKHVWDREMPLIAECEEALEHLRSIKVPCEGGVSEPLCQTYLPLPSLQSTRDIYLKGEDFPFLELPTLCVQPAWAFLTDHLGVSFVDDVKFRIRLLVALSDDSCESLNSIHDMVAWKQRLANLYLYIEASCLGPDETVKKAVVDAFEDECLIWSGRHDGNRIQYSEWVSQDECLWNAPADWKTTRVPLQWNLNEAFKDVEVDMEKLRGFFQGTLKVADMSHHDCILELCHFKEDDEASFDLQTIRGIYVLLAAFGKEDQETADEIKARFDEYELVCVFRNGSSSWQGPSGCVWSNIASIGGKVAINSDYPELEGFFLDILAVEPIDALMVYNELIEIGDKSPTVAKAKDLILALGSLLDEGMDSVPAPGPMLKCCIFPVRARGKTRLSFGEREFVILDRGEQHYARLAAKVRCLDFSLSDVCRLRSFFKWAGLEGRYITVCAEESSRVDGGIERPISERNREINLKAYGLLRVAAKYNLPRFQEDAHGLYDLLHNAVTLEARGISSTLCLAQGDADYEVEIDRSDLHVEDRDGALKVYVPEDVLDQDVCFSSSLPRRLLAWMMAGRSDYQPSRGLDGGALHIISILLDRSPSLVSRLLEKEGVPEIDVPDRSAEHVGFTGGFPDAPPVRPSLSNTTTTPSRHRRQISMTPDSAASTPGAVDIPSSPLDYETPLTQVDEEDDEVHLTPYSPSIARRLFHAGQEDHDSYRRLLERVVATAKASSLPRKGGTNLHFQFNDLAISDEVMNGPAGVYGYNDSERRKRIGAAGELFVFEFLQSSRRQLPGFDRDCWQSTMRHFAETHPDYEDLTRFSGRETSDIVYDDASGVLTKRLVKRGYLADDAWQGKTPKYYIEVKSTMDGCETPFFASDGQYQRMVANTNGEDGNENQDTVYALFRVFNLGKESMGLKIFVDPEQHRRQDVLRFVTDKYTISPGPRYYE